jgi:hypothetical protein
MIFSRLSSRFQPSLVIWHRGTQSVQADPGRARDTLVVLLTVGLICTACAILTTV